MPTLPLITQGRVQHLASRVEDKGVYKIVCSCGKDLPTFAKGMQHLKEERVVR